MILKRGLGLFGAWILTATGVLACEGKDVALQIAAEEVTLTPDTLDGVRIEGAWELTAPDPSFGGFSGLVVASGHDGSAEGDGLRSLVAIGDRGLSMSGVYRTDRADCIIEALTNEQLLDLNREALSGDAADAEALAAGPGAGLLIAFERNHRIQHLTHDGVASVLADPSFATLPFNAGLEALAIVPEGVDGAGDVIAIAERAGEDGFPVFRIAGGVEGGASAVETRLMLPGPHRVTGADIGADGALYLVRRHYDPLIGVDIVIEAMPLPALFAPDAAAATRRLARFGPESGIDNMEAIAVSRLGADETRLTLISDDNFSHDQRTLLIELSLTE